MDAQLRNAIQAQIQQLGAAAPQLQYAVSEKLYELFALGCLLRALDSLGAQLEARDANDQATNILTFRLGPGVIYSPTAASGFIRVVYNGSEYEVQNGLRCLGKSRVLHELDVCLLDRTEGVRCRVNQIHPVQTRVRLVIEYKYYGDSLPLALGREYLGLVSEFNCRVKTLVSNVSNDSIHQLITGHRQTQNFETVPANLANVDRFVNWLANELRQVL